MILDYKKLFLLLAVASLFTSAISAVIPVYADDEEEDDDDRKPKTLEDRCVKKKLNSFDGLICVAVFAIQDMLDMVKSDIAQLQSDLENIELTPGPAGPQGESGEDGSQGPKGDGCSVSEDSLTGDITIACEDGSSVTFNPEKQEESIPCPSVHIQNSDGTCTYSQISVEDAEVQDADNDDDCESSPSSIVKLPFFSQHRVGVTGTGNPFDCVRAYYEYDISSIPDNSEIINTEFIFSAGFVDQRHDCDFVSMINRPSITSASTLWSDFENNNDYVTSDSICHTTGNNKKIDLGNNADSDIESQLSSNWFAFGIMHEDDVTTPSSNANKYIQIDSITSPTANPQPTLEITYRQK